MKKLYSTPFRVYLCLFFFAVLGVFAGMDLPISLYPNTNKPTINTGLSFGGTTAKEFLENFGETIESRLQTVKVDDYAVEKIRAYYNRSNVNYRVEFEWGTDPKKALKEVENLMNSMSSNWSKEVRDSLHSSYWAKNSGFIAISFFSEKRSLDELYDILDPAFSSKLKKVEDASGAGLWNPNQKEVLIELDPQLMASLGLFPKDIQNAISNSLRSFSGGTVTVGINKYTVQLPHDIKSVEDFKSIPIATDSGRLVNLSEIATIDLAVSGTSSRIFKTNGSASLILFASPRTGGNVKNMAEEVISIVKEAMPSLPKDIQYKVLVDPSEFIRSAVKNVLNEVFMAAGLAVLVLFMFIGSFKNTITAAIEIPLSMILSFILMKLSGMNINLISLGGLALSAGMNVDASVVVMENIFRYMEENPKKLGPRERIDLIIKAVKEVALPVIGATIASLVVFIPLAFTSNLTNAILGDLAKAVVFSHGFSAFVALILVPTIRLHIMNRSNGKEEDLKSPIEGGIKKTESLYAKSLNYFIQNKTLKIITFVSVGISLFSLLFIALPKLKREIIGMPDTDWMILGVNTSGNSLIKQMENETSIQESKLLSKFGKDIKYTFVQIQGANSSMVMARLKDKSKMGEIWKAMQENFVNTPTTYFWVAPWNPAELPIPDPAQFEVSIRGGDVVERAITAREFSNELKRVDAYPRVWTEPNSSRKEGLILTTDRQRWFALSSKNVKFSPYDLMDLSRVVTQGKSLGKITLNGKNMNMQLSFKESLNIGKEDLESIPIKVKDKFIPLKALLNVDFEELKPQIFRENGQTMFKVFGKLNKGQDGKKDEAFNKATTALKNFESNFSKKFELKNPPRLTIEDAQRELTEALEQLAWAVGLSIALIALVLIFQFGSVIDTLIVLTAVPLGIMGVILSLLVFNSTLSLNSALGVILLNGIAVANSIILVDFIKKLIHQGVAPRIAAVEAAKKRLRPILITSLTTILGMIPIAVGLGEGGKILQPLGIAVSGGLWFSMLFTLYFVPALEVMYYEWKLKRDPKLLEGLLSSDQDSPSESREVESTQIQIPPKEQPAQGDRTLQ